MEVLLAMLIAAMPERAAISVLVGENTSASISSLARTTEQLVLAETAFELVRDPGPSIEDARAAGVGVWITLSVASAGDRLLFAVRAADVARNAELGAATFETSREEDPAPALREALGRALGSRWIRPGSIAVSGDQLAEVSLGSSSCAPPCVLARVAPGEQQLIVRDRQGAVSRHSVIVRSGETAAVIVEAPVQTDRAWFEEPWVLIAAGALVAGAAIAGAVAAGSGGEDGPITLCFEPRGQCP